jgi:hypothetical protein
MMRRNRPLDDDFQPEHRLYYRIELHDELEGNHLDPQKIRAAFDISVNWSKYSKPWDVIFGTPASGIASVLVRDIFVDLPLDLASQQREVRKPHLYRPVHEPYEDNYSHSVIAVFKDGARVTKSRDIGAMAKREFRQLLSDKAEILFRPSIKS